MEGNDGLFGKPIEWRYTMKNPRLAVFDARLIFFVLLLFLHLRVWTALLLVIGVILFWAMERYGYRFSSSIRGIRARLAGPIRPARPLSLYRPAIDFGFEEHPTIGKMRSQAAGAMRFGDGDQRNGESPPLPVSG